jgi:hypothetical protein
MPQQTRFVLLAGLALAGAWLAGACRPIEPAATLPAVAANAPPATAAEPAVNDTDLSNADLSDADLSDADLSDTVTISLSKPGDTATVRMADGRLLIEIASARGIGAATLTWKTIPAAPPILRLHLGGLEELRLTTGSGEILASVASSPPHTVSQSARSPESTEFQPLAPGQQEWLDISWSSGAAGAPVDPAAAIFPLEDGYFDVVLGAERLVEPGASLAIRWIDFYR